ncbi:hypothetical protein H7X46_07695 [Pseudonocardia sp. C8]|uniref:hypothetical protein n=1 Tax=Pseudonocardia sp. C8 TaxID=2762759 RepID=UPI001643149C|nr:hypothetical protein [Pseudonocardia sp. C8]MBC3190944.1 hypothetical protein [Pseudonocardia sp. C8]
MATAANPFFGRFSWRWAGPPGQDTVFDAENRHEIRAIWREVCAGYRLTRRVVPDDGPRAFPHIGQIELGPPTRFTVRLRPGQLADDIADLIPRLAAAYEVDDVRVSQPGRGWALVELIEHRSPTLTIIDGAPPPDPGAPWGQAG